MTDEQILELARSCEFLDLDDGRMLLCCDYELLKFARLMYEEGYDQGCFEATGGQ